MLNISGHPIQTFLDIVQTVILAIFRFRARKQIIAFTCPTRDNNSYQSVSDSHVLYMRSLLWTYFTISSPFVWYEGINVCLSSNKSVQGYSVRPTSVVPLVVWITFCRPRKLYKSAQSIVDFLFCSGREHALAAHGNCIHWRRFSCAVSNMFVVKWYRSELRISKRQHSVPAYQQLTLTMLD